MDDRTSGRSDHIVVGVDGTTDGDQALRYAVAVARRTGAVLRLVHVGPPVAPTEPLLPMYRTEDIDAVGTAILDDAADLVHRLAGPRLRVEQVLAHGQRTEALVDVAGAAPLVLGTRGAGAPRFAVGATGAAVAASAAGPVVCVPRRWSVEGERALVLAAVDGTEASRGILEVALAAAAERGAELLVVHAWRPPEPYDERLGGSALAEAWERQAEPVIWNLVAALRADHPNVDVAVRLRLRTPRDRPRGRVA